VSAAGLADRDQTVARKRPDALVAGYAYKQARTSSPTVPAGILTMQRETEGDVMIGTESSARVRICRTVLTWSIRNPREPGPNIQRFAPHHRIGSVNGRQAC